VKRDPRLEPLSDDHHRALVLARRCRQAGERGEAAGSLEQTWAEVRDRFARELEPHFRVEERWLLPALETAGEREGARRARADHARLRELVRLPAAPERVVAFGTLLHDHVRFEERELFPCAERVLPPDVLAAVGRAALEARSGAGA
jgi:hypothetical protein